MLRRYLLLSAALSVLTSMAGCAVSPWEKLAQRAQESGLEQQQFMVGQFSHTVFYRRAPPSTSTQPGAQPPGEQPVVVFIEGDGRPWRNQGWHPNPEPRPRQALALELMRQTPAPAWYLTRPCYDGNIHLPACTPNVWTDARYAPSNVDSMIGALRQMAERQQVSPMPQARHFVLVGYSGGGSMAVLMAAQMPEVIGVVTIAANLDVQAWTQANGYSPLIGSLNPATDTADLHAVHVALHGLRDDNVPASTLQAFIDRHPATQWWYFNDYDHVCCWQRDWPTLWPQVQQLLAGQRRHGLAGAQAVDGVNDQRQPDADKTP